MAITLKRQLTEAEKEQILSLHGRVCWATGHPIPDGEALHFDHIRAFSTDGQSELHNIAPMCEIHNKQKGSLSLEDFRVKLRQQEFFALGDTLTLGDLLKHLQDKKDITAYGRPVILIEDGNSIRLEGSDDGHQTSTLYQCPTTGWKYFYATLPISVLDSDDDKDDVIGLQPRYLIPDRVFELYRHFQRHPVLQPSIGRIVDKRIKLFDGQHKIAGLLWGGRKAFECKIYVTHDVRLLNQTNISAHDKFAQARFFSSIMVLKLGSQFGLDFNEYKNNEDGDVKSEERFLKWLDLKDATTAKKADRTAQFRSYLYNAVLEDESNKLTRFVSKTNRGTDECPFTIDLLSKSIFACFMLREPVDHNMLTDAYKRHLEVANVIFLMNCLNDQALSAWNPKAGPNDPGQRRLRRMIASKPMMAWSEILRDAICGKLNLNDAEDREAPFYRELNDEQRTEIRDIVARLCNWKWWSAPANGEIDKVLSFNKGDLKQWFKEHALTTGYLMGAPE
jgi:hypothetical protein